MTKLQKKLIDAYVVLVYYNMINDDRGKTLDEVPTDIREEVEIRASERYLAEYKKIIE